MAHSEPKSLSPDSVYEAIRGDAELALLDVREEQTFSESHILYASCMPLSRLEAFAPRLVVRRSAPVVVCDAGEGLAERAAARMLALGYTDVSVLEGGTPAWRAAGFELFSGVNVPSKAFGEYVEHAFDTPSISADELHAMLEGKQDMVVLDSRPFDEYERENIPTGVCVPGAELAYRVHEIAPESKTTVVVNCAGRTRSIIGAQSLINAGIANRVVALRNGTMGWHLAGFDVERGAGRRYGDNSPAAMDKARASAASVAERFNVPAIDRSTFERWQAESDQKSLFLLDVRSPEEYAAGHLPGSVSAPGGQLVQETDMFVGTLRARVVLVDDTGVRARMTASWLQQMGWKNAVVWDGALEGQTLETGPPRTVWLGEAALDVPRISAAELESRLASGETAVVDLSISRHYKAGHIPGARFAIRARLGNHLAEFGGEQHITLVCEDGKQSAFAAVELGALLSVPVAALDGGVSAWRAAGLPLEEGGETWAEHPDDVWLKPFERGIDLEQAMEEYLVWEVALVEQLKRDRTAPFIRDE